MISIDRRATLALLASALVVAKGAEAAGRVTFPKGPVSARRVRRFLAAVAEAEKGTIALDVVLVDDENAEFVDVEPVGGVKARDLVFTIDDEGSGRSLSTHLIVVGGWREMDETHTAVRGLFSVRTTEVRRAYVHYEMTCISEDPTAKPPKTSKAKTDRS